MYHNGSALGIIEKEGNGIYNCKLGGFVIAFVLMYHCSKRLSIEFILWTIFICTNIQIT